MNGRGAEPYIHDARQSAPGGPVTEAREQAIKTAREILATPATWGDDLTNLARMFLREAGQPW